jgi:hypothetical protein
MGPVPGLILGILLTLTYYFTEQRIFYEIAEISILINLFNLLPISPLDGGRFLEVVLFRQNYNLELVFRIVTGIALVALGIASKAALLVIFPLLYLFMLPEFYKTSKAAKIAKAQAEIGAAPKVQLPIVRQLIEQIFKPHPNKKVYLLRVKRILERIPEESIQKRTSVVLTIVYVVILPLFIFLGGTAIYWFKEPTNLTYIKRRPKVASFSPANNSKVIDPILSAQIESMNLSPYHIRDTSNATIDKSSPEDIHIAIIAVSSQRDAESAIDSLSAGKPFEEAAARFSEGPNASAGGDIGYINPKDLDEQIRKALESLGNGEHSNIIKSNDGFIIVKRIE